MAQECKRNGLIIRYSKFQIRLPIEKSTHQSCLYHLYCQFSLWQFSLSIILRNVTMPHCSEHNSNQRYCSEFHEKLIEFRDDGKFCDVNIRVQDEIFKCHRLVLASASEYFDRMFGGNFKEANQSEDIVLHEIDAKSFDLIIKCLYNQCTPILNELNVCDLLRSSEFLGISKVKEQCVLFICDNIQKTDDVALELFSVACAMNDSQLMDCLSIYILKKLDVFVEKSTFLDLSYNDLRTMLKCYRASSLTYKCENVLLDALIRWVYFAGDRKQYFMNLVEMLDFDRIGTIEKTGNDKIFEKNAVINGVELNELYYDCYSALELSMLKEVPASSINTPTLHIYFLSVSKRQRTNCTYHVLSLDNPRIKPRWYPSCSFSSACRLSSIISLLVLNEPVPYSIYCMDFVCREFWAHSSIDLSQSDRVLKRLTPLKFFASYWDCKPCMRKIEGEERSIFLYRGNVESSDLKVFRGFSLEESNRGIYRYNCELDHWYPVPEMKKKVSGSCFISDDKLVYLIGGENIYGINENNYVQAYDHRISEWFQLPNTINSYFYNNRNYCAQGCAANGKLYLSDGRRIEVYDPVASRWEKFPWISEIIDVDEEMAGLAGAYESFLTFYSNSLWVMNRLDSYQTCDNYDFSSQKWCKLPFMAPKLQDTFTEYEPVDVITA